MIIAHFNLPFQSCTRHMIFEGLLTVHIDLWANVVFMHLNMVDAIFNGM